VRRFRCGWSLCGRRLRNKPNEAFVTAGAPQKKLDVPLTSPADRVKPLVQPAEKPDESDPDAPDGGGEKKNAAPAPAGSSNPATSPSINPANGPATAPAVAPAAEKAAPQAGSRSVAPANSGRVVRRRRLPHQRRPLRSRGTGLGSHRPT